MDKKAEEFYDRLKVELERSTTWPASYLYKFIVPTDENKINQIENSFNCLGAVITTTQSKTGKFTSISVDVQVDSPQDVINKYIELSTIEGIVSL